MNITTECAELDLNNLSLLEEKCHFSLTSEIRILMNTNYRLRIRLKDYNN